MLLLILSKKKKRILNCTLIVCVGFRLNRNKEFHHLGAVCGCDNILYRFVCADERKTGITCYRYMIVSKIINTLLTHKHWCCDICTRKLQIIYVVIQLLLIILFM